MLWNQYIYIGEQICIAPVFKIEVKQFGIGKVVRVRTKANGEV